MEGAAIMSNRAFAMVLCAGVVVLGANRRSQASTVVGAPHFQHAQAKMRGGDSASGRIVEETNEHLDLDTSPCDMKNVVRFVSPYKKAEAGTGVCNGEKYTRYVVEQD